MSRPGWWPGCSREVRTRRQAAVWGAYLHARSGERLAASVGRVGYLAREIARELPAALGEVEA